MRVRIYIEGGGKKTVDIKCRQAFRSILEKAGFEKRMPSTRACGSREDAFDDFKTAARQAGDADYPMLLVDSEGPVQPGSKPWPHLKRQDNWAQPDGTDDDQAQLMVQCMETWCIADREALKTYYGQSLNESALPPTDNLEIRSKDDVQAALDRATRPCGKRKRYAKGRRSFELVQTLNPAALTQSLPHFRRLIETLERLLKQ